jgi:putative oxidoreductase
MWLNYLEKYEKYTVLFIRVSLLFVLFARGRAKLEWWVARREGLWEAMATYWITFFPAFWWFLAAYAESIWTIFIALWLFTRYNAFLLAFTMLTVLLVKITGDPWIEKLSEIGAPVFIFVASFAVMLTWAGKIWNLEKMLFGKEI